jgi:hypothetical protein
MGIHLDFSGKHGANITNRNSSLFGGFPNLCDPLCIFVRFCEATISRKSPKNAVKRESLSACKNCKPLSSSFGGFVLFSCRPCATSLTGSH